MTWWREQAGAVLIACGRGHIGVLKVPGLHAVASDGTVSPSCVCPREGCDWHEAVRLVGWVP